MDEKILDLSKILGANVVAGWDSGTPDPGVAFLQGKTTSMLSPIENGLNTVANTTNSIANQIDNTGTFVESGSTLVSTLSQIDYNEYAKTIKDASIGILKREIVDYAKEKMQYVSAEIMTASTSFLAQRTAYWTGVYSKSGLSDILASMMSPIDASLEQDIESQTKAQQAEKIAEIKDKASAVTSAIDSTMNLAQEAINSTLTYIKAGPSFIETNLNKYLNLTINPAKKQIDNESEKIIDDAYSINDEIAQKLGQAAGNKITEELKRIAEKKKAETEKTKITVISFAKSALDLVKKKALALIGG